MEDKDFLDRIADFLAHNRGFPVILGAALVLLNFVLHCFVDPTAHGFFPFIVRSELLMTLGVIIGLIGVLLGDAL